MNQNEQPGIGQVMRSPTLEEERERLVPEIKEFRKTVDGLIRRVTMPPTPDSIAPHAFGTREPVDQVRIHLIDAKMWAGKILEALGNPFPAELADSSVKDPENK